MTPEEAKQVIIRECLSSDGFAASIRENKVDKAGFDRLKLAISVCAIDVESQQSIDRVILACLFELPWEIENTVEHYSHQSKELGSAVASMADSLRVEIHELLWKGLESYYK